jgi:putative nucleotidyltransferase with HDIG domain
MPTNVRRRRIPRFLQWGIRWKIMAPYALLTAAFAILGSFLVTRLVTGSLEERFSSQLIESSRVASDAVVRKERQHLGAIRAVAYTEGLAEAVAASDSEAVARLAGPVSSNVRVDRLEVLGRDGNLLFGAHASGRLEPSPADEPYLAWSIVNDVLAGRSDGAGDRWAQVVWTSDGPAIYTAAPVKDGDLVVGVVLVGTLIDSLLTGIKAEALADVTLYTTDGELLGTTFAVDDSDRPALVGRGVTSLGSTMRFEQTLFGRGYDFLVADLRLRNEVVGRYAVALPTGFISSAGSAARWEMGLLFGAVTLLVLGIGLLVARHFAVPLLRVVVAARQLAGGDLSARTGVHGTDEIGVLASTFDVMAARLQRQHLATIGALASAIDARDPYTAGHSTRVGDLAYEIGRELGLASHRLQHLRVGGYLHDIGKIGIRDSVLLKQGALTPEERALIEEHPAIGLRILAPADLAPEVLAIVGGHHERLNGTGYPARLSGDEITIFPRIVSVADVYDALSTSRPYRAAMTLNEAMVFLLREVAAGTLDPEVVNSLKKVLPAWEAERRREVLRLRDIHATRASRPGRIA